MTMSEYNYYVRQVGDRLVSLIREVNGYQRTIMGDHFDGGVTIWIANRPESHAVSVAVAYFLAQSKRSFADLTASTIADIKTAKRKGGSVRSICRAYNIHESVAKNALRAP